MADKDAEARVGEVLDVLQGDVEHHQQVAGGMELRDRPYSVTLESPARGDDHGDFSRQSAQLADPTGHAVDADTGRPIDQPDDLARPGGEIGALGQPGEIVGPEHLMTGRVIDKMGGEPTDPAEATNLSVAAGHTDSDTSGADTSDGGQSAAEQGYYEDMTVEQLRSLLDQRGVDHPSTAKKADLVALAEDSE